MTGIFMVFHGLVCVLLVLVILMQSGRGGGLTEGFASAESIFGAKTNSFMVKATTVLGGVFLLTCLSLAVFSSQKGRSLMEGKNFSPSAAAAPKAQDVKPSVPTEAAKPATEAMSVTQASEPVAVNVAPGPVSADPAPEPVSANPVPVPAAVDAASGQN